jgi:hypothetical protein
VVEQLKITLLGPVAQSAVVNSEAFEKALQARYLLNQSTENS